VLVSIIRHLIITIQQQQQRGIERVQALADVLHSALCCHSNETRVSIANPPNSAQLEGTPAIPPTYVQVCAVVWECSEGQTDTCAGTLTCVTNIGLHFASATPHVQCNHAPTYNMDVVKEVLNWRSGQSPGGQIGK